MTQRGAFGEAAAQRVSLFTSSLAALDVASTSAELEGARSRAAAAAAAATTANDARERAQQRRAEAACPSLRQAMQTLARPFDAKQQAAAATAAVAPPAARAQRHSRRTSSRVDAALVDAPNAADSLRDALDRKARELGHSDSSAAAVAPHAVAAAPSAVAAAAPSGNGSASGLATFRDAMRGLLSQSQAQRDRDVDAMTSASEAADLPPPPLDDDSASREGAPPTRESGAGPPPRRSRVDLADLIDIEAQLDAEFGPIVSGAMRSAPGPSPETGAPRTQPQLRSGSAQPAQLPFRKQSSARSSRRNSFTDVAASLGFQLITMPAAESAHTPVAPAAPGSKLRSGRDAPAQSMSQRQRLSEGNSARDGLAAAPSHTASRGASGSGTSRAAIMSRRSTLHYSSTSATAAPVVPVPAVSSRSAASSRRSTFAPDAAGDLVPGAERRRDLQDALGGRAPPLRSVAFASSERAPAPLPLAAMSHRADMSPSRPSTAAATYASWFGGADSAPAVSGAAAAQASGSSRRQSRPRTAQQQTTKFTIHNKTTLSAFMKTKPPVFAVDMPIASARSAHSSPSRLAAAAAAGVKQRLASEAERPASVVNDDESDDSDDSGAEEKEEAAPLHPEIPAPQSIEPERARPRFDVLAPSSRDRGASVGRNARRQTAPPGQPLALFRGASRSGASSPVRQQRRYIRSTATSVAHSRAVSPTPMEFAPQPPSSRSGTVTPHPPSSHHTAAGGVAEVRKRLSNGSATAAAGSPTGSLRPTPPKRAPQPSSQPLSRRTSFSGLDLLLPSFPALLSAVSPVQDVAAASSGKVVLSPLPNQPAVQPVAESEAPDLPSPDAFASKLPALDSTPDETHDESSVASAPANDPAHPSVLVPSAPGDEASTSSLHSAASSATSTATATATPSPSVSSSVPPHLSSQHVEEQIESDISDLESSVKDRIREHNKLRHAGNTRADHVCALTRQLTLLDDALAREREDRAQGSKALAAKEAELADLVAQHESLQLENAQIDRDTRELHRRYHAEEKNLLDHRAFSHQLEQRIAPAQHKLAETRAATTAILAECASMRETFAVRARKYAADLREQKRNAETLEMLRTTAARTQSMHARALDDGHSATPSSGASLSPDPSTTEDDSASDARVSTSSSGSPAAATPPPPPPSHEQRLWHGRMSVIQAATGLDDFVVFAQQLQSQPEKRAESLRQQQRLQTRLKALSAERIQLAKLLGMKRMAAVNMRRIFGATPSQDEPIPALAALAPSLSDLRPLLQSALSKLEAVEVKLSGAQPRDSTLSASASASAVDPAALVQRLQLLADQLMAARSTSKD